MARRKVNLKKRLDELRNEPEPAISVSIMLNAPLFRSLSMLAAQQHESINNYIRKVLQQHLDETVE